MRNVFNNCESLLVPRLRPVSRYSSNSSISFHGKVVIVTGAGGALGRQYVIELAKRGAKVVVNDTGGSLSGSKASGASDPASSLVKHIVDSGGIAVADNNSVSEGQKIIDTAINSFGRCDVLINNAGILRDKSFTKMTHEEWHSVIDVHLNGTFSLCHAAWQHMVQNRYGRIVNIGSGAGLYGNFGQANYSAAKMGILGLTNTLAIEGEKYNILANCVVPVAASRMTETVLPASLLPLLDPQQVVPIVSYLASDACQQSGSCFEVGGGWFSQVRIQRSRGVHLAGTSAEDIARNIAVIGDFSVDATYPTSPADAIKVIANPSDAAKGGLPPPPESYAGSSLSPSSQSDGTSETLIFESDWLFETLKKVVESDPQKSVEVVQVVGAAVYFEISSKGGSARKWLLDLRAHQQQQQQQPSVSRLSASASWNSGEVKPEASILCSDETLVALAAGKMSAEGAFLRGLLKIKGRMAVASKVKTLLEYANKSRGSLKS